MKPLVKKTVAGAMKVLMTGTVALGTKFTTEKAMDMGRDLTTKIVDKVRPVEILSSRKIMVGDEVIKGRLNCKKFLKEKAERVEKIDKVYTVTKKAVSTSLGVTTALACQDLINETSGWSVRDDLKDISVELATE